jgi:hypothetical protein
MYKIPLLERKAKRDQMVICKTCPEYIDNPSRGHCHMFRDMIIHCQVPNISNRNR